MDRARMAPQESYPFTEPRERGRVMQVLRPIWCLAALAGIGLTVGLGNEAAEEAARPDAGRQASKSVRRTATRSVPTGTDRGGTRRQSISTGRPLALPAGAQSARLRIDRPSDQPLHASAPARAARPVVQLVEPASYLQPVDVQPAEPPPSAPATARSQAPAGGPQLRLPFQLPPMRFEELPPPPGTVRIPLAGPELAERVQIKKAEGRLTVVVRDVPLNQVLMMLGEEQNLNIVVADNVTAPVSVALENVELSDVLDAVTHIAGYTWTQHNNIIHVTSAVGATRLPPHLQARRVMVFPLDYVSAADLDMTVQGLLSPLGQSFVTQRNTADNRRTQEVLVAEDTPEYLQRIAQFIEQADQAPRQVMIQAHVMAVTLKEDDRHGVNWEYLFNPGGHNFRLEATGLAVPAAPQAFFFNVDGTDLDALVECIQATTDSKTLASPKVLVLNNQEARLQVGKQLGFRVTTTTETSTLESVDFLDVGVVLRVTPRITRDGRVVMYVKPEVSSGLVNPDTGLPEEETTEVETNILLPDGRGMVIGGLIQEKNIDSQTKLPLLGDIWMVGKLFQRKTVSKERVEIIITLLPRIVPAEIPCDSVHDAELRHATAPVLNGPLLRADRPWEPELPDAVRNPLTKRDLHALCPRCRSQSCNCGIDLPCEPAMPYYGLPAGALELPPQQAVPQASGAVNRKEPQAATATDQDTAATVRKPAGRNRATLFTRTSKRR